MTINPRDYDLSELDEMPGPESGAHDFSLGVTGGGTEASNQPESVLRSNQQRELHMLESMAGDSSLEKPYLSGLPETYAAELVVFEWLEFLLEQAGFGKAFDVLRYYASIGWISDDMERELSEYIRCFDDQGDASGGLSRSDHVLSLVYIARLSSME